MQRSNYIDIYISNVAVKKFLVSALVSFVLFTPSIFTSVEVDCQCPQSFTDFSMNGSIVTTTE